jgi:hypothetical protein
VVGAADTYPLVVVADPAASPVAAEARADSLAVVAVALPGAIRLPPDVAIRVAAYAATPVDRAATPGATPDAAILPRQPAVTLAVVTAMRLPAATIMVDAAITVAATTVDAATTVAALTTPADSIPVEATSGAVVGGLARTTASVSASHSATAMTWATAAVITMATDIGSRLPAIAV